MKVSSINFSHNITFKSEPLAYDDEVSRERRNFIRSHLDYLNFGYSDIYEKEPRLEEYELNKLVKFYSSKPKKINIDNLNIVAKKIDSAEKTSIYRGQSLMYSSDQDLKNLKDAGCNHKLILKILELYERKDKDKIKKELSVYRDKMLQSEHKIQKQIDCLDYFLYEMERKGI